MPEYVAPARLHPYLETEIELGIDNRRYGDVLAVVNDGFVIDDHHWLAGRPDIITIKPLPEAFSQVHVKPHGMIAHTQGGPTKATNENVWSWCNSGTGTEREVKSEPNIIGPEMSMGKLIHCVPFDVRADSNYLGNSFYVWLDGQLVLCGYASMETQDEGSATLAATAWSLPQLNVMAAVCTAYCATYRIPCGVPATSTSRGIAHHSLHPAWSKTGHDCPRRARIQQMDWLRGETAKRLAAWYQITRAPMPA